MKKNSNYPIKNDIDDPFFNLIDADKSEKDRAALVSEQLNPETLKH